MIKKGDLYYPTEEFKKKAWINDEKIYKEAGDDPIKFWEKLAGEIIWKKKWDRAFEHKPPYFQWFLGGKLNITENCLDRNLEKYGDKIALIWEPEPIAAPSGRASPSETGREEKPKRLTYEELFKEVCKFANALKELGVRKGDRVGIYLPMIPEVIISMLACARIGAVHSVVFSAFSPQALRVRLQDTEAKILITADGYYRRGQVIDLKKNADAALSGEPKGRASLNKAEREGIKETSVEKLIIVKRAGNEISWQDGRDVWYNDLIENEKDFCEAEAMDSEDLLFILYTSGSTGKPKGCVHTCAGFTVQAKFTGKWIFDWKPARNASPDDAGGDGDVFWSTADLGWITGHTYSCYGPLLNGITFLIFEGAPDFPTPDRWAQIIEKYKVTIFYTAPTAIRMFEKYGAEILKKYQFNSLRLLGTVGEPIDESAWQWYFKEVGREKCPLVDTWWQTETGGILITSLPGIGPFKPAFTGLPFPGTKFDILDEKGKPCKENETGNLVLFPPFAPGLLRGIYKNPEKYLETYWSQYAAFEVDKGEPRPASPGRGKEIYFTSDGALRDENNLIRIVGRVDDVIKVAGHRVSTGELENAINLHPEISESAVVGVSDEIKGEVPVAFVVYKGKKTFDEIKKEVIEQIKKEIGPIALPKEVYLVEDLPKTRSGKIMRRILKKLIAGEDLGDLSTLSNPESVEKIKTIVAK